MSESKTPRTDSAKEFIHDRGMTEWVPAELSSALETELSASKAREYNLAEALEAMMRVVGPMGKVTWADDDQINDAFGMSEKALEAWRAAK